MPSIPVVHYATSSGNAICGRTDKHQITARPTLVTCPRCKDSKAWREMMEEEPL